MASAKKKKMSGSEKCEKGLFKSEAKDAAIPLCDDHYPDEKAKNSWLVLFYKMEEDLDVKDGLNRIAMDLGNEPPSKSKALTGKGIKQRARLKSLSEKYEFDLKLPKKGPSSNDPFLKVGAVCCDCGVPQTVCEGKSGLHFVKAGEEEALAVKATDPGAVVTHILDKLGFVKGAGKSGEL